jgi:hypothetical protein
MLKSGLDVFKYLNNRLLMAIDRHLILFSENFPDCYYHVEQNTYY